MRTATGRIIVCWKRFSLVHQALVVKAAGSTKCCSFSCENGSPIFPEWCADAPGRSFARPAREIAVEIGLFRVRPPWRVVFFLGAAVDPVPRLVFFLTPGPACPMLPSRPWRRTLFPTQARSRDVQITVTTPALLFPAISLFMLAFTNRFLSLGSRIRSLHDHFLLSEEESARKQISNLRKRIYMIRQMQGLGVLSMLSCILSMICLVEDWTLAGEVLFGVSLALLMASLWVSFLEIRISVNALDILLEDMEKR
jgi:hypothetical protein